MFRTNACGAALALSLLTVSAVAARACEGDDCPAPTKVKPLDIRQFMREQAASTRVADPSVFRSGPAKAHTAAKVRHHTGHAVAASASPPAPSAPLATEAAASFASQAAAEPVVPTFPSSEFAAVGNAASIAAPAPSAETMGAAFASDPSVQVVAEAEFNDIDRKADTPAAPAVTPAAPAPVVVAEASPVDAASVKTAPAQPAPQQPSAVVSWLQWLWAAVSGTFTALAAAVRQLTHV
jgi:hypothetical protein